MYFRSKTINSPFTFDYVKKVWIFLIG